MLLSLDNLRGFAIRVEDGAIGQVDQFYFDDEKWAVRYLVVSTGHWLSGRQVLISPISIEQVDCTTNQIFLNLTMREVKESPDIDTHKPVSRQHESTFLGYYGYPYYWGGPDLWGAAAYPVALAVPKASAIEIAAASAAKAREGSQDSHLRSTKEVKGYHLVAIDGEIGHVDDFIVEDESWALRYLVVDTHNWWPGKKVLLSPQWIECVSWPESKVRVHMFKEAIKRSPEYSEAALITREYEDALYLHYGQRGYWDEELPGKGEYYG
jgi:uncharacterized protein YrrD